MDPDAPGMGGEGSSSGQSLVQGQAVASLPESMNAHRYEEWGQQSGAQAPGQGPDPTREDGVTGKGCREALGEVSSRQGWDMLSNSTWTGSPWNSCRSMMWGACSRRWRVRGSCPPVTSTRYAWNAPAGTVTGSTAPTA